jgi:carboxylesterase
MHLVDQSMRFSRGRKGFLLIHGVGGTPQELRYVACGLGYADYTVHVPQLAGHGVGAHALGAMRWTDWYETVEKEHRVLCERCDSVVVGGVSTGAILALHHAARRPHDVSALVLYAPSLWRDGWRLHCYASAFNLVARSWFTKCISFAGRDAWASKDVGTRALEDKDICRGDAPRDCITALPGDVMLQLCCLVRQVHRELGHVRQPTLIVHPRADDRTNLRNINYLLSNLAGLTETVVLDNSDHLFTLNPRRQLVLERTLEFASRIGKPISRFDDDDRHFIFTRHPIPLGSPIHAD